MSPEILNQLKDVHLPPAPSWWPLAPGLYLSLGLLGLIVGLACIYYHKKKPGWVLKKQLRAELYAIEQKFLQSGTPSALQNDLVQLVRRVLIKTNIAPQAKITGLNNFKTQFKRLFGSDADTLEFMSLLEQERFQKNSTQNSARLMSLANKKFRRCKI